MIKQIVRRFRRILLEQEPLKPVWSISCSGKIAFPGASDHDAPEFHITPRPRIRCRDRPPAQECCLDDLCCQERIDASMDMPLSRLDMMSARRPVRRHGADTAAHGRAADEAGSDGVEFAAHAADGVPAAGARSSSGQPPPPSTPSARRRPS